MSSANNIKRIAQFGPVFIQIHYRKDFIKGLIFKIASFDLGEGGPTQREKEK